MTADRTWASADAVRHENARLDRALLDLINAAEEHKLDLGPPGEWTLAENLAHLAEFPAWFARQLRAWLDGEVVVVGRVAEFDAARNDAIVRARGAGLAEIREAAVEGFARLARVLEDLDDAHLGQIMRNVKYGEEPLTAYLDRYVVGHKAAHERQLRTALAAARAASSAPAPPTPR